MVIFQIRFQKKVTANQIKGGPFWPPLGQRGLKDTASDMYLFKNINECKTRQGQNYAKYPGVGLH